MTTPASYTVHITTEFFRRCRQVPKQVWKKLDKDIFGRLRQSPTDADPPLIKKLTDWRDLWRYRVGNYRVLYKVDEAVRQVTLLDIGHRKHVYKRLGHEDGEGPSMRLIKEQPLDRTPEEPGAVHDGEDAAWLNVEVGPSGEDDAPLPLALTPELLEEAGVPERFWARLGTITTEGALLEFTDELGEFHSAGLLDLLYPKPTREAEAPARVVESAEALADAHAGERSLESYLLPLDESQKPIVERFKDRRPSGPWVVKGGPGTGKSTLALYCMRELLSARQRELFDEKADMKILFTTFTKSLSRLSSHLFASICDGTPIEAPTITNVHQYAVQLLDSSWKKREQIRDEELSQPIAKLLEKPAFRGGFTARDAGFLAEEVAQSIFGNSIQDEAAYGSLERRGRGRPLGAEQRKSIWRIYEALRGELEKRGRRTFAQTIAVAEFMAKPEFDYVFIDEAQDLSPSAIRLCIKLCKNSKNVFLTADLNQSIYGSGISWASIDKDLDMSGRSLILRRNFRTTVEICEAIEALASGELDEESRLQPQNAVHHGEFPVFAAPRRLADEIKQIEKFLQQALLGEGMSKNAAAVLCPTNRDCKEVANALSPRFNARFMDSQDVDFTHPGVRVMTIHAAKGLQFGVAVVARIDRELIKPLPASDAKGDESLEAQTKRRLLFVGCSRPIRRLMLSTKPGAVSTIPSVISPDHWEIWGP